jgi:AcrR family transcriptional regulator
MTDSGALGQLLSVSEERFDEYAERILEAARAQLVQFGMRRTSLDDIARAAGVGRATLFRRFPSRDALMLALASREAQRSIAAVDAQVTAIEDPEEFLAAGALAVIHEIARNELLQRLLVTDAEDMLPLLTASGTHILTLGRVYMAGQLQRLIDQGGLVAGDPDVIAELLARLVLSLALNPDSVLPLDDDEALSRLVRSTIAPLILRS